MRITAWERNRVGQDTVHRRAIPGNPSLFTLYEAERARVKRLICCVFATVPHGVAGANTTPCFKNADFSMSS